ncbi:unnamed protein product [Amoebophrya sp. A120]|nr:unnamed protein product [Amoebophrya sp. A120]|eukprot:GSA120T00005936001.1
MPSIHDHVDARWRKKPNTLFQELPAPSTTSPKHKLAEFRSLPATEMEARAWQLEVDGLERKNAHLEHDLKQETQQKRFLEQEFAQLQEKVRSLELENLTLLGRGFDGESTDATAEGESLPRTESGHQAGGERKKVGVTSSDRFSEGSATRRIHCGGPSGAGNGRDGAAGAESRQSRRLIGASITHSSPVTIRPKGQETEAVCVLEADDRNTKLLTEKAQHLQRRINTLEAANASLEETLLNVEDQFQTTLRRLEQEFKDRETLLKKEVQTAQTALWRHESSLRHLEREKKNLEKDFRQVEKDCSVKVELEKQALKKEVFQLRAELQGEKHQHAKEIRKIRAWYEIQANGVFGGGREAVEKAREHADVVRYQNADFSKAIERLNVRNKKKVEGMEQKIMLQKPDLSPVPLAPTAAPPSGSSAAAFGGDRGSSTLTASSGKSGRSTSGQHRSVVRLASSAGRGGPPGRCGPGTRPASTCPTTAASSPQRILMFGDRTGISNYGADRQPQTLYQRSSIAPTPTSAGAHPLAEGQDDPGMKMKHRGSSSGGDVFSGAPSPSMSPQPNGFSGTAIVASSQQDEDEHRDIAAEETTVTRGGGPSTFPPRSARAASASGAKQATAGEVDCGPEGLLVGAHQEEKRSRGGCTTSTSAGTTSRARNCAKSASLFSNSKVKAGLAAASTTLQEQQPEQPRRSAVVTGIAPTPASIGFFKPRSRSATVGGGSRTFSRPSATSVGKTATATAAGTSGSSTFRGGIRNRTTSAAAGTINRSAAKASCSTVVEASAQTKAFLAKIRTGKKAGLNSGNRNFGRRERCGADLQHGQLNRPTAVPEVINPESSSSPQPQEMKLMSPTTSTSEEDNASTTVPTSAVDSAHDNSSSADWRGGASVCSTTAAAPFVHIIAPTSTSTRVERVQEGSPRLGVDAEQGSKMSSVLDPVMDSENLILAPVVTVTLPRVVGPGACNVLNGMNCTSTKTRTRTSAAAACSGATATSPPGEENNYNRSSQQMAAAACAFSSPPGKKGKEVTSCSSPELERSHDNSGSSTWGGPRASTTSSGGRNKPKTKQLHRDLSSPNLHELLPPDVEWNIDAVSDLLKRKGTAGAGCNEK